MTTLLCSASYAQNPPQNVMPPPGNPMVVRTPPPLPMTARTPAVPSPWGMHKGLEVPSPYRPETTMPAGGGQGGGAAP
jgi:hypothetical protein